MKLELAKILIMISKSKLISTCKMKGIPPNKQWKLYRVMEIVTGSTVKNPLLLSFRSERVFEDWNAPRQIVSQ